MIRGMSRRKRPAYTAKSPSKAASVKAPKAVVARPRRRKPRKQDFVAAAIALAIVAALALSAVGPYFLP